jgi:RNA polymerase sigma-70 factor (ECF subfamily)
MQKNSTRRRDPVALLRRSTFMLITVDPAAGKDLIGERGPSGGPLSTWGQGSVNGRQDNARPDWVSQVERVRDHQDREAFAELFRHFAPRVKGFLMKSGADATLAEECAQDVMATLWHKAHLFDPARASVATWVFTIARNRKIDLLRKQRRPEPEDLPWGPEAEPAQDDALALQQESENLRRALAELPDAQRELIERAYFGDLSHSEIAAETGLPLGTIKSRIRLALERLRHAMR